MSDSPFIPETSAKGKEDNILDLMEAFQIIGEDIQQIGKLNEEEKTLTNQFFDLLNKKMKPLTPSIAVTSSALPYGFSIAAKALVYPNGLLALFYPEGGMEIIDLTQPKNRDIMIAVFVDVVPKLISFKPEPKPENPKKPVQVLHPKEPVKPEPVAVAPVVPEVKVEAPVNLPEVAPALAEQPPAPELLLPGSIYTAEQLARIEAIKAETLEFIELLSNEKFEYSPISRFFDDWMVNLKQVVTSFASNGIIEPDDDFNKQFSDIFNDIEEQLAKRLLNEAEIEVSTKTLEEDKQILGEINAGYAAQTKDIVTKGTSAIDFLIKNVKHIEEELAELEKTKTSYLHPLKKITRDQKQVELTKKLYDSKKRLAMAVQSSTVNTQGTGGDLDAEYAAQAKELATRRRTAINFLVKEVRDLEKQLNALYLEPDSRNPIKRLNKENRLIDVNLKLNAARKQLRIAEQDSGVEQKKLHDDYLKKKQTMVGKMRSLEKDIKTKEVDNSMEQRKAACNSLATAVKSLIERKTAPPKPIGPEEEKRNPESDVAQVSGQ
jgi:hypothetical protein